MTTTYEQLIHEVRSAIKGYNLTREQTTFLNSGINASAGTFTVSDPTYLPAPCMVEIDSECIDVRSVDTETSTATVSPDGRGWDGTTAATHSANARVTVNPVYPTWRIGQAINNTIVGVYPDLYAVGTTSFTFNPAVTTYSMPADAAEVLKVTATVVGPTKEQAMIHAYSFNADAPEAEFATGKCITLREGPWPSQTVTVAYRKVPAEIAAGDDFTDSGLAESARRCIVYGAVAELLSYMDAVRTLADSAVAKAMGPDVRIGSATQMSAQLTARYQMELEQERRRLRQTYPVQVRRVGR